MKKAMIKRSLCLGVLVLIWVMTPLAARGEQAAPVETGKGLGLEVSTGLIGIYSPVNVGLILPKLSEGFQLGLRLSWSMPAILVPHYNRDDELISYLPWMATGSVFLHAGTGVIGGLLRAYFGLDLLAGTTVATQAGIIGDNVTVGAIPYAGVELYFSQRLTLFLECGLTATFALVYGEEEEMGGATQHGATGTFINFGPRWYFGR